MSKINEIRKELNVPKNQYNKYGHYYYRSCEDILEALKPTLYKYDAILTITDEILNIGNRYYVKIIVKLKVDEEIYEAFGYAREEEFRKGMDASQITGSASSYARKYALNALFLIDDVKDSDSTNKYNRGENEKTKKFEEPVSEPKENESENETTASENSQDNKQDNKDNNEQQEENKKIDERKGTSYIKAVDFQNEVEIKEKKTKKGNDFLIVNIKGFDNTLYAFDKELFEVLYHFKGKADVYFTENEKNGKKYCEIVDIIEGLPF